jgi:hypothetical protein
MYLYRGKSEDEVGSITSFFRARALKRAGYPVKVTLVYFDITQNMIEDDMWLEFETEEEAAIFKLTHL